MENNHEELMTAAAKSYARQVTAGMDRDIAKELCGHASDAAVYGMGVTHFDPRETAELAHELHVADLFQDAPPAPPKRPNLKIRAAIQAHTIAVQNGLVGDLPAIPYRFGSRNGY